MFQFEFIIAGILGLSLILLILWDAFETIILPRRVTRRFRLARYFFRYSWTFWTYLVNSITSKRQERYLGFFGPISLLVLLAVWAGAVILGFALLHWAFGSEVRGAMTNIWTDLYLSGTTFFTLGIGDVTPQTKGAKILVVLEAGVGFGLLAIVIGYLPALNASFSRREMNISLLDARAGSPSSAFEMLKRHCGEEGEAQLCQILFEWERWAAEFLEIHLSYPVLAYYRSQHENQSWLSAVATILDTSAIIISGLEGGCKRQAKMTFAIARHALVDLAYTFHQSPELPYYERLDVDDLEKIRSRLIRAGFALKSGTGFESELKELRQKYEPFLFSLSQYFCLTIPPLILGESLKDNWEKSAWDE